MTIQRVSKSTVSTLGYLTPTQLSATYVAGGALPSVKGITPITDQVLVTAFQSGHGFTSTPRGNTVNLNDMTDSALGSQCVTVTTIGDGSVASISKTLGTPADLSNKVARVWLKGSDLSKIGAFSLVLGSGGSSANSYQWGVLDTSTNATKFANAGEWVAITLPFGANLTSFGTPNRAAINYVGIDFKDNNTGNPITMQYGGIAFAPDGSDVFPHGVVTFSFDDAYTSQYSQAKPYMDIYGFPGSAYLISETVDGGGGITVAHAQEMRDKSGWEMGAHAFTLANHNAGYDTLSNTDLTTELLNLRSWMKGNFGSDGSSHLALPGGRYLPATTSIVRQYFNSARTTYGPNGAESFPVADGMRLRSIAIVAGVASIETAIDKAYTYGHWLNIYAHDIVPGGATGGNTVGLADFQTIVDYCAAKGIPVRTVSEVAGAKRRQIVVEPAMTSGNFYGPPVGTFGTVALTSQRLSAVPIIIRSKQEFTALAVNVTGAGGTGSAARLGIYADNGHSLPGSLVVDGGTVATDSSGIKTVAVDVILAPGLYWLACLDIQVTSAPTLTAVALNTPAVIDGYALMSTAGASGAGYFQNTVTGALPATWLGTSGSIWATPPIVSLKAN